jgi:stage II sporulation protein E
MAYLLMVLLNNVGKNNEPYSLALFAALLILNYNIPLLLIIYNLSFISVLNVELALTMGITSMALVIPFIIYRILKRKPKTESIFFIALSLLYYLLKSQDGDLIKRAIVSAIIVAFSFISLIAIYASSKKLFKCRLKADELICCAAFIAALSMGFLNLFGLDVYKAVSLYLILIFCFIIKNGNGIFLACNLALPLAIVNVSFEYIGLYTLFAFVILCFSKYSKILSALSALLIEVTAAYYFQLYGNYSYYSLIAMVISALAFLLTPTSFLNFLEKKTEIYKERHLPKVAINRNRTLLSNKLYEIANVFKELEGVFDNIKSSLIGENTALKCVITEIDKNICSSCENYEHCNREQVANGLYKLTKVGMSKGKVNLIDIPSDISSNCVKPNNVLYAINRMLIDYRNHLIEAKNNDSGREMIARQAGGIGEILKGLALESSQNLNFESRLEKRISETLLTAGIIPSEILIYGDSDDFSVNLILPPSVPSKLVSEIVSDITNKTMTISEKTVINDNKCSFMLKTSPPMDAVFGVSMVAKQGSERSGDTYSVLRISEQKFMVALSDGMGTGESAERLSSAAISLIEGFFKVGMPTDLVLSTVNRVLNFNQEESYACLDIALIDLTSGETGIIKIGSPFGFIIRNEEIKILENDSLPIGILDQLKPNTKKEQLLAGDLLLLISDGISLAFGSSTDMFEFLKNCPSKNPQVLCDSVLKEAIRLYGGIAQDDMTVLATRVFEKTA